MFLLQCFEWKQQFCKWWLPCRKDIEPTKIKGLIFDREDFAQRGKKKRPLVTSPKKKFKPLAKSDKKPLSLIDFASAFEKIVPNSILFGAATKPKSDSVWEIVTDWQMTSIGSLIELSKTIVMFLENLDILSIGKFIQTELFTRGQCCNDQWYFCRKGVITASKAHEVITKMKKVKKRK